MGFLVRIRGPSDPGVQGAIHEARLQLSWLRLHVLDRITERNCSRSPLEFSDDERRHRAAHRPARAPPDGASPAPTSRDHAPTRGSRAQRRRRPRALALPSAFAVLLAHAVCMRRPWREPKPPSPVSSRAPGPPSGCAARPSAGDRSPRRARDHRRPFTSDEAGVLAIKDASATTRRRRGPRHALLIASRPSDELEREVPALHQAPRPPDVRRTDRRPRG